MRPYLADRFCHHLLQPASPGSRLRTVTWRPSLPPTTAFARCPSSRRQWRN